MLKGICDKCGEPLTQRKDDNEETAKARFETYFKETAPLVDYYKNKNVLEVVSVLEDKSALDIFKEVEEIINRD